MQGFKTDSVTTVKHSLILLACFAVNILTLFINPLNPACLFDWCTTHQWIKLEKHQILYICERQWQVFVSLFCFCFYACDMPRSGFDKHVLQ